MLNVEYFFPYKLLFFIKVELFKLIKFTIMSHVIQSEKSHSKIDL